MHNAKGQISFSNLNDYQHNVLTGLIDSVNYYALGDSRRSLPIRFLKQQESLNDDTETGLKHKQFNSKYYEYHLVPVLENQMVNPMIQFDETKQGLNANSVGEMVIISIDKPLVNDLFDFYIDAHQGVKDQKELFRIIDVNFLRTSGGLNIYRLNYETSTVNVKNIYIEKSFFYFNDFRRFYSTKYIEFMKKIATKDYLVTIEKYYHTEWSIVYDETLSKETNLKLNKVILFLKYKDTTNSSGFPLILINGFDPSLIVNPFLDDISDDPTLEIDSLQFVKEDVWYPDPDYITPIIPIMPYDFRTGKIQNELAFAIWEACHYYKPFIFDHNDMNVEDIEANLYQEININGSLNNLKNENNLNMINMNIFRNSIQAEIDMKGDR